MDTNKKKHKFEQNSKYLTISIYTVFVILTGCIIFRLFYNLAGTMDVIRHMIGVLSPFLIGLLIAYMMNPMIKFMYSLVFEKGFRVKRKKLFQIISIIISYLIVLGALGLCLFFVIPQLIESIAEISNTIPLAYDMIMDWFTNLTKHGQNMNTPGVINVYLNQNMPKVLNVIEGFMGKSIPMLYDMSMQAIKILINLLIAIIVSIYLSFDKKIMLRALKKFIYAAMPLDKAEDIIITFRDCNQIFGSYLTGKALDSLIIGILCFIFMVMLKLPLAVLISLIVGITNMIPYFGPFIGAIPGICILAFLMPVGALKFLVMVFLLQQFDGYILGPRILGNSTGVRPIAILFAIIVGGAYFGAVGMFLGVPVFAVIQYLVGKWTEEKLKQKEIEI